MDSHTIASTPMVTDGPGPSLSGYSNLLVEVVPPIATVTLNRPDVLNSLSDELIAELTAVLGALEETSAVRSVVLTGGMKVFASGSDIRQMVNRSVAAQIAKERGSRWASVMSFSKPLVAAVNGYVLGGGCELAMMCDLIVAGDSSRFGQPEVKLGILPGAGGTQRWPRTVGKQRAMEINMTGEGITALRAYRMGLVNKVVPEEATIRVAQQMARMIAANPPLAVRFVKDSVNRSLEMSLSDGLAYERKNFHLLFTTEDQREGMTAFLEKRPPEFQGR